MNRKLLLGIIILSMVIYVNAQTDMSGNIKPSNSLTSLNYGYFNYSDIQSHVAYGGNVTRLNITSATSTVKWQLYMGEFGATLYLGRNASDYIIQFSVSQSVVSSVVATENVSFNFANVYAATVADLAQINTEFGYGDSDVDNVSNVFNTSRTFAEIVGVRTVNLKGNMIASTGCDSSSLPESSCINESLYRTGVFKDVSGALGADGATINNTAYASNVFYNQYDFGNHTQVDYELLVPANLTMKRYNFFLKIT